MVLDTKFRMRSPDRDSQGGNARLGVIGSKAVGKTALMVRYLTKRFIGDYQSDRDMIYRASVPVDGRKIFVEILDLSSDFGEIVLPKEKVAWAESWLVVYSITSFETFQVAEKAIEALLSPSWAPETHNIPILLMANKKDLEHIRQVPESEGRRLAERFGCKFVEVSASEMDSKISDSIEGLLKLVSQSKGQTSPRLRKLSVSKMITQLMNRTSSGSNVNGSSYANSSAPQEKMLLSRVSFRDRAKRRCYLKNS